MTIHDYIFREYDIRGEVERDFPPDVVTLLGKGSGTYFRSRGAQRIALSGDVRKSTPGLKSAFARGLLSTGIDVVDLGTITTPMNYFSLYHLPVDGSVQITGSHNPPAFNGFKLSLKKGEPVYGDAIQSIRRIIKEGTFAEGSGRSETADIYEAYQSMLQSKIKLERPLSVVMDCGNAAGCISAPDAFRRAGLKVKELFCTIDGDFPNHHPDPTVEENLLDVVREMKTGQYDAGFAFDGDADRVGLVDEKGRIVWADIIMALLLPEILTPGERVVFDVKCSQALEETIVALGGRPVMWKTGHSLIKNELRQNGGKIGGELSGHIFLADEFYGFDDAVYVALRIARLLSKSKEPLSALIDRIPAYVSSPEIRFDCADDASKFEIARRSAEYFRSRYPCIEVDGVRIKFPDGWGLVRPSNTQPSITCRYEARTREGMERIEAEIKAGLKASGL